MPKLVERIYIVNGTNIASMVFIVKTTFALPVVDTSLKSKHTQMK